MPEWTGGIITTKALHNSSPKSNKNNTLRPSLSAELKTRLKERKHEFNSLFVFFRALLFPPFSVTRCSLFLCEETAIGLCRACVYLWSIIQSKSQSRAAAWKKRRNSDTTAQLLEKSPFNTTYGYNYHNSLKHCYKACAWIYASSIIFKLDTGMLTCQHTTSCVKLCKTRTTSAETRF